MLQELNNLRDEAESVDFPGVNATDVDKATAVIKLLIAIGMLAKIFTGPKGDAAIDQVIYWIKGISTGALIIQKVTDKD